MLQQRPARLCRRHALAAAGQERYAEHVFHVADAGRGGGERQMRAFGAVGDAAGFDDMAEQAEIGKIKTHGRTLPFALCENRFQILLIALTKTSTIFAKYESWPVGQIRRAAGMRVAAAA